MYWLTCEMGLPSKAENTLLRLGSTYSWRMTLGPKHSSRVKSSFIVFFKDIVTYLTLVTSSYIHPVFNFAFSVWLWYFVGQLGSKIYVLLGVKFLGLKTQYIYRVFDTVHGQWPRKDEGIVFPHDVKVINEGTYFWSGNLYLTIFFASVILPIVKAGVWLCLNFNWQDASDIFSRLGMLGDGEERSVSCLLNLIGNSNDWTFPCFWLLQSDPSCLENWS